MKKKTLNIYNVFIPIFQNTFLRLKDSTKQLLGVLQEIQSKVHTKSNIPDETFENFAEFNCQHNVIAYILYIIYKGDILYRHHK